MKLCTFLSILTLTSSLGVAASAQTQTPDLAHLYPGYAPTVFETAQPVLKLFSELPTDFKAGLFHKSQCFQRAEVWSYGLFHNHDVQAMKVFIFYTHAYRNYKEAKKEDFDWWFHVAPYVLYKTRTGEINEAVLDPIFADKPMKMKPWAALFVDSGKECKEFVRFSDFAQEVKDGTYALGPEHCYLVRVPATDFDPVSVEDRDSGKLTGYQYNIDQVRSAVESATQRSIRKEVKTSLGL